MTDKNNDESYRDDKHATPKEVFSNLYESAIEAEKETGRREKTQKSAKRSLIVRVFSIFAGSVITILGLLMMVGPGPGLLMVAAGLGILAIDVPFARRLLNIVKNRLPQDESGKITPKAMIVMGVMALIGISLSAVSAWYAFFS